MISHRSYFKSSKFLIIFSAAPVIDLENMTGFGGSII